ncbi:unnamed protein product [Prorocentrum cordatum]|uniref:Acyltransferase 3 domain-containing protein n=1 Tax=Prorocentrum cordatum TaxID=2364126 RepID=A0ABN9PRN8_9DINO|nr:unnamed protein product [Polarella glacialis]
MAAPAAGGPARGGACVRLSALCGAGGQARAPLEAAPGPELLGHRAPLAGAPRAAEGEGPAPAAEEALAEAPAVQEGAPGPKGSETPGPAGTPRDQTPASTKARSAKAPRLDALDAPRWLCSCMIVCYHFYKEELGVFAEWGSAWTQFFFVLSGFVLAYVEMARPVSKAPNISQLEYLRKRLITVYPTYLLALLLRMLTNRIYHPAFDWAVLPMHVLLIQSWVPICIEKEAHPREICVDFPIACGPADSHVLCATQRWNGVAWFMSCLVVYWLLLRPLARHFRTYSIGACPT